jgi:hypothetical protein
MPIIIWVLFAVLIATVSICGVWNALVGLEMKDLVNA